jgi:hypothetical protein
LDRDLRRPRPGAAGQLLRLPPAPAAETGGGGGGVWGRAMTRA